MFEHLSAEKRTALTLRLLSHVDQLGGADCWEWTKAKRGNGYGSFKALGKAIKTNRAAYELLIGNFDSSLQVLHQCDNPICVNPCHLYLGTHEDNMRDMVKRNRSATGERNGARLYPERKARGRDHWIHSTDNTLSRKLSESKAVEIKRRRDAGESGASLAREFDVSPATVSSIFHGTRWAHISTDQ